VAWEQFYAKLMQNAGFVDLYIERLRKRNSKKELFEFIVSGKKALNSDVTRPPPPPNLPDSPAPLRRVQCAVM
jgi:hypothetical protein